MFRKIDDRILAVVQAAYLWIYDRTGVTVGMLSFATPVVGVVIDNHINWFSYVYALILLLDGWYMHNDQVKERIAKHNARAERSRLSLWRTMFLTFMLVFVLTDAIALTGGINETVSDALFLLWGYVAILKIRKREPPERHALQTHGVG